MAERNDIADQSKYPSGQAPRGLGQTEIKATAFREKAVMNRNDPNGDRFRPSDPTGQPPRS